MRQHQILGNTLLCISCMHTTAVRFICAHNKEHTSFWYPTLALWSGKLRYFSFSCSASLMGLITAWKRLQAKRIINRMPTTSTNADSQCACQQGKQCKIRSYVC